MFYLSARVHDTFYVTEIGAAQLSTLQRLNHTTIDGINYSKLNFAHRRNTSLLTMDSIGVWNAVLNPSAIGLDIGTLREIATEFFNDIKPKRMNARGTEPRGEGVTEKSPYAWIDPSSWFHSDTSGTEKGYNNTRADPSLSSNFNNNSGLLIELATSIYLFHMGKESMKNRGTCMCCC